MKYAKESIVEGTASSRLLMHYVHNRRRKGKEPTEILDVTEPHNQKKLPTRQTSRFSSAHNVNIAPDITLTHSKIKREKYS